MLTVNIRQAEKPAAITTAFGDLPCGFFLADKVTDSPGNYVEATTLFSKRGGVVTQYTTSHSNLDYYTGCTFSNVRPVKNVTITVEE